MLSLAKEGREEEIPCRFSFSRRGAEGAEGREDGAEIREDFEARRTRRRCISGEFFRRRTGVRAPESWMNHWARYDSQGMRRVISDGMWLI